MTSDEWLADMADERPPAWWHPGIQAVRLVDNWAARQFDPHHVPDEDASLEKP